MSKKRWVKATRSAKRRYGIWVLSIASAIILVAVVIVAFQVRGTSSPSTINPSQIPRTSVEEVKAKLDAGSNIVIVDVRSQYSYERSHIAGAISIPLGDLFDEKGDPLPSEEVDQRYSDLHRYDEIITYCT